MYIYVYTSSLKLSRFNFYYKSSSALQDALKQLDSKHLLIKS